MMIHQQCRSNFFSVVNRFRGICDFLSQKLIYWFQIGFFRIEFFDVFFSLSFNGFGSFVNRMPDNLRFNDIGKKSRSWLILDCRFFRNWIDSALIFYWIFGYFRLMLKSTSINFWEQRYSVAPLCTRALLLNFHK